MFSAGLVMLFEVNTALAVSGVILVNVQSHVTIGAAVSLVNAVDVSGG
jgi:hypothetical protein